MTASAIRGWRAAAARAGMAPTTIRRMVDRGKLMSVHDGHAHVFNAADLDALREQHPPIDPAPITAVAQLGAVGNMVTDAESGPASVSDDHEPPRARAPMALWSLPPSPARRAVDEPRMTVRKVARNTTTAPSNRDAPWRETWRESRIEPHLTRLRGELAVGGIGWPLIEAAVGAAARALAMIGDTELSGAAWPGWIATAAACAVLGVNVELPWMCTWAIDETGQWQVVPQRPIGPGD